MSKKKLKPVTAWAVVGRGGINPTFIYRSKEMAEAFAPKVKARIIKVKISEYE